MPDQRPAIRVLCVDDHRVVLEAIARLIEDEPDIETVGRAVTGGEAVELFRAQRPDVTLMDLQLPDMSGVDAIRMIRHVDPEARIIVLTMYQGDEDIYRAFQAGIATYLLKDILADELVLAIRDVHAGRRPIGPKVEARLIERSAHETLTKREIEIIDLMLRGLRNKEIAASLNISEETVKVHVKNILAKLEVNDRTAAVNVALRRGIVHAW
jgi:two-component system, NarL family, response regulator